MPTLPAIGVPVGPHVGADGSALHVYHTVRCLASVPNLTIHSHCFAWVGVCCALMSGEGVGTMRRVLNEFLLYSCMGAVFMAVVIASANVIG